MNKLIWIFGGILVVVAIAGAVLISRTQDAQERAIETAHEDGTGNANVGASGVSTVVTYTDTGFSPASVTIAPGTTVTWSNESSHSLWIMARGDTSTCPLSASAPALNECASISRGGSFSHTFTTVGTNSYLNKEKVEDGGSVTVSVSEEASTTTNAPTPAGPLNRNVILQ